MVAGLVLVALLVTSSATSGQIAALEKTGSRLGLAALDLASGAQSTNENAR